MNMVYNTIDREQLHISLARVSHVYTSVRSLFTHNNGRFYMRVLIRFSFVCACRTQVSIPNHRGSVLIHNIHDEEMLMQDGWELDKRIFRSPRVVARELSMYFAK